MLEMYLKQPRLTNSACGPFTKIKERIQKLKETEDSRYIYKNELDKACLQHNMAYGDFNDLAKTTVLDKDKVLRDKASYIAENPEYDGYQRGNASMVYNFFDKKTSGSGANNKIKQNQQLAEELHKVIIRKSKKIKELILHLKRIFAVLI